MLLAATPENPLRLMTVPYDPISDNEDLLTVLENQCQKHTDEYCPLHGKHIKSLGNGPARIATPIYNFISAEEAGAPLKACT